MQILSLNSCFFNLFREKFFPLFKICWDFSGQGLGISLGNFFWAWPSGRQGSGFILATHDHDLDKPVYLGPYPFSLPGMEEDQVLPVLWAHELLDHLPSPSIIISDPQSQKWTVPHRGPGIFWKVTLSLSDWGPKAIWAMGCAIYVQGHCQGCYCNLLLPFAKNVFN